MATEKFIEFLSEDNAEPAVALDGTVAYDVICVAVADTDSIIFIVCGDTILDNTVTNTRSEEHTSELQSR